MYLLQFKKEILLKKTSWIQTLAKEQLIKICEELNQNTEGSIEDLRKKIRELVKNDYVLKVITKHITMFSNYGQIEPFNGQNFELFQQQLDCIISLNDVSESKRTPLLITNISSKVLEILNHLCSPNKPIKKTYEELITILENRYAKSTSTALDRATFRSRNQKPNEKIEDYVMELKKLAKRCGFTDFEDQVKEKFMDGVNKQIIKFELLKNGELALDKLIVLARTVEAAMIHTKVDDVENRDNSVESGKEMFQLKKSQDQGAYRRPFEHDIQHRRQYPNNSQPKRAFRKPDTQKNKSVMCFVCGRDNHLKRECTLRNKFCSECGKQGHIFKMCKLRQTRKLEVVTDDEVDEINYNLQNLFTSEDQGQYSMYSNNSCNKVAPQFLDILVEGKMIKFELDTGSEVSTITLKDQKKLLPDKKFESCDITFKNFDQSISSPLGMIKNLNVSWNNVKTVVDVYVVSNEKPTVIGRNWLMALNQWPISLPKNRLCDLKINDSYNLVETIKNEFSDIFSPGWGNFKGECITLKLKNNAVPKFLPIRPVPLALKDKIKIEIERLLQNKRIAPVKYSKWGTPIVPVLKPDGTVRLCGDYKVTLNPYLETDRYPLPNIETIFETLKGGEYYCELDLKEAYLQAPLDPESQELTVINTEFGTFKYLFLPYGVNTGPGSFQRLMSQKLNNIPNVIVFIDNIYLCGKNYKDMYETLKKVLIILKESELKLKVEKCKFFEKNITVFGYNINKKGISIVKENIAPILKLTPPTNVSTLRSFLGKVNYYNRFLKDMATTLKPLYDCTKKGKFNWTPECQNSFELIKQKLMAAQKLSHYNQELTLVLTCDASAIGISAILSNRETNGIIKPIAFASKKLSDREQKYTSLDKEALAIIFGVTKYYNFLYGRSFELETDNTALVRIFGPNKGIPKMAAKRLQHYAIFLSAFNYKIKYISTDKNPADYLSRMPTTNENCKEKLNKNFEVCTNYIDCSELKSINWEMIQKETSKNSLMCKIKRYCSDGWPENILADKILMPFYIKRNEISVDRSCLFWGHRIIIPDTIRQQVLHELHKSHFGSTRMIEIAKSYFWWPKLNEDIINITKQCTICLSHRNTPSKTPLRTWPVPPSPWYRIHADFLGPLYGKMFLVVVDSYSKWPEVFQMANIGSGLTIKKFKELFLTFGFPIHLVTDNGTSFTSQEFKNFTNTIGMKHTFTPPYHPATNGAAERFVETFKANITKMVEGGKLLNYAIGIFLSDYRVTPQKSTGISPAKLMLGREIRNRFSLLRPTPIYQDLVVKQNHIVEKNRGHRKVEFKMGQSVFTRDFRKGHKPWTKGIIVKESIPGVTYFIEVDGVPCKRHVNQMITCL